MKKCADKPCPTCPWLKSSKVGGDDIRDFSIQQMRDLSITVPERGSDSDGFFNIMACHHSKEGEEYACAGYMAVHGLQNINVRIMALTGDVDLPKVLGNCEGLDLYDNFYTMLDDYENAQHT
jgi:hypothetical protein